MKRTFQPSKRKRRNREKTYRIWIRIT